MNAEHDGIEDDDYDLAQLLAAAKRYGVNAAAIAKDLTEEFEEEERANNHATATPKEFKKLLDKVAPVVKAKAKKKAAKK